MKRWLNVLVPLLLLAGAAWLRFSVGINDLPLLQELGNLVFDNYQRAQPRPYNAKIPVRIVDIDEASLQQLGQWPWPRTKLAQLVDRLAEAGAAVVVFDILFPEPDRLSPANLQKMLSGQPGAKDMGDLATQMPDPDAALAHSFERMKTVTAFALTPQVGSRKPAVKWGGGAQAGDDPTQFLPNFSGAVPTLAALEATAHGNGCVNFYPDADNTVRRVPLLFSLDGDLYPSLAAEALRVVYGAQNYVIKSSAASGEWKFGGNGGIVAVLIGERIAPTTSEGSVLLYDSGHKQERFVSAWEVMADPDPFQSPAPSPLSQLIQGQIVLVGSSAAVLKDRQVTPVDPVMAGVEVHAQIIEQILGGQFLQRPDWADGAELIYLVVLGVILVVAIRFVGALLSLVLGLAGIGCAVAVSWYGFAHSGYLIDPLYPSLVALVVYISGSLLGYLNTESEKRFVREAMGLYTSPELVDRLTGDRTRLALGGETREITVLFSDIRGFTRIAEDLDPKELTKLVNRFLTPLTRVIRESGGWIDKYMGDSIMAFWNAPEDVAEHPRKAVRAALAMRAELHTLNDMLLSEAQLEGEQPITLGAGIGLNTGHASVGNMGSEQRLAYSAMGDTVNIASRLEGLSRAYGIDIVMGEETARFVQDFALLELDQVRVKGRESPLRIFTVLGDESTAGTHFFLTLSEQHAAMLVAYRQKQWQAARSALQACRQGGPALVALYDVYEQRIAAYEATPPPDDWDGVYTATTKQG